MSIASASTTVKFHEFPSGNVLHNYQPGAHIAGPIRSISWSKDGNWLALVPSSGLAEIVSVKDQLKLIHTVQAIEEPSCAVFQNTTKKNIAIGTKSGQVLIYDVKSRNVKKRYPRTTSMITHVEFTFKDSHVIAACENGDAYLYSYVQNNLSGTFKIPRSQSISALKTNPIKRNLVVAGSNEGVVAVWDIHGNKNKFFMGSHQAQITAVAFSPVNADFVVSAGLDRQFCFYNLGDGKCVGNIFVENSMTSVAFSPDGKFLVMASQKGKIYVYDITKINEPVYTFVGHNSAIQHLAFRKDEDYETSVMESPRSIENCNTPRGNKSEASSIGLSGSVPRLVKLSQGSVNEQDSFLAGISVSQNNTGELSREDGCLRVDNKNLLSAKYTPVSSSKIMQEMFATGVKTSTPECFNFEAFSPISPAFQKLESAAEDGSKVITEDFEKFVRTTVRDELKNASEEMRNEKSHQSTHILSQTKQLFITPTVNFEPRMASEGTEDLAKFVRSAVRDEMKAVSEELKNEMNYQSTHIMSQTRQLFLNLLMSSVRESIKIENQFISLREELTAEESQSFIEQNLMLKQKVAALEEEIAVLKINQFNQCS